MARRVNIGFNISLSRPVAVFCKRFSVLLFIILSIFIIFISNNDSKFSVTTRNGIIGVTTPVIEFVSWPINFVINFSKNASNYFFVYERNQYLEEENRALNQEILYLTKIKSENERLRRLLNFANRNNLSKISAKVVGNTSGPYIRSILINAGKDKNVEPGLAVIGESGVVGRILDVSNSSSKVLLLTDITSKIPVISSLSKERGILEGNSSPFPNLKFLPKNSKLKSGELVVTSGDGGLFPPGINIGLVYKKNNKFFVKPFEKWTNLDSLTIVKPKI